MYFPYYEESFAVFTDKIKTFLSEFYVDGSDGGKDFIYGQQLVGAK